MKDTIFSLTEELKEQVIKDLFLELDDITISQIIVKTVGTSQWSCINNVLTCLGWKDLTI